MKVHLLRDVRPTAISLVSKGANRKRWVLLKSGEVAESDEPDTDALILPAAQRIVKADGWDAAYCVVAEPGWQEDPGKAATDQSIPDEWADEDEIRKAAHRFMESGALVNAMHKSLDPWGTVVENYVAPADFMVGSETIRKGSWVIAIRPNDAGREAIDKGEFTGISIEGLGRRELVEKAAEPLPGCADCWELFEKLEKAEAFTKPGTANVSVADRKKLAPLLRHYASKPHPFTSCYRDQVKHGLSPGHAKRRCAVLKDLIRGTTRWRGKVSKGDGDTLEDSVSRKVLRKIGEAVGLKPDELAELDEVEKAKARTFGEAYAQRDFEDELPDAFEALRSAIFSAFYPPEGETRTPTDLIGQSLDEFKDWALELVGETGIEKFAQQVADDREIEAARDELVKAGIAARSGAVKAAMAAARKKYPDGIPPAVRSAIFKDPAKWLADNGEKVEKAAKTTDAAWDGSASRFTDDQYKRSCVLDRGDNAGTPKQRYGLPIREPNGVLNVNALGPAAAALAGGRGGVKGASSVQLAAAKRKLAAAYRAAGEEVPDTLAKFSPVASAEDGGSLESEMGLTEDELKRVEGVEERLDGLEKKLIGDDDEPGLVVKMAGAVDTLVKAAEEDDEDEEKSPTADELQKSLDEVSGKVDELGEAIEKLGDGTTSQNGDEGTTDDDDEGAKAERVVKAYEDRKLDPNLVGILG